MRVDGSDVALQALDSSRSSHGGASIEEALALPCLRDDRCQGAANSVSFYREAIMRNFLFQCHFWFPSEPRVTGSTPVECIPICLVVYEYHVPPFFPHVFQDGTGLMPEFSVLRVGAATAERL